jgi:hypothetical protein
VVVWARIEDQPGSGISYQITHQGQSVGRVVGPVGSRWAAWIAEVLAFILEGRGKRLAAEVLDKYRAPSSLPLIETGCTLQAENIARMAVLEACQLIKAGWLCYLSTRRHL